MKNKEFSSQRTILKVILRIIGTSSLTAMFFVFAPYSLMNQIHAMLGLGVLSDQPIVGYLARSTSAFYALVGGLMWVISFDIKRYMTILNYLGYAILALGACLIFIDWAEGLPMMWKLWEGPFVILLGIIILGLNKKMKAERY